jgi:hypothetical protein
MNVIKELAMDLEDYCMIEHLLFSVETFYIKHDILKLENIWELKKLMKMP